jgi:hypothetical protein
MKRWAAVASVCVILLSVVFVPSHAVPSHALRPSPVVAGAMQQREPHPEINAAIKALENARAHLQKAAHDFGGHRVESIAAIDKALEQLRLALAFDKGEDSGKMKKKQ